MKTMRVYAWFVVLFHFGFALDMVKYAPFLLSLGLTLSEISLVNVWFVMACLAAEIPTGVFADRYGRVRSIRVGLGLIAISSVLYATATGFVSAVVYEMGLGLGLAFMNGAVQAWLKDALAQENESEQVYHRAVATGAMLRSLALIAGGVVGTMIAGTFGYRVMWLSSAVMVLIAWRMSHRWMRDTRSVPAAPETSTLHQGVKVLVRMPSLAWISAAGIAFRLVLPFNHFWAPFIGQRAGDGGLILAWIGIHASLAVTGVLMRWFLRRQKASAHAVVVSLVLSGVSMVLVGATSGFVGPLCWIVLHEMGRGAFDVLHTVFTQDRIDSAYRATFLSMQSFACQIGGALVLVVVWAATHAATQDETLIVGVWNVTGSVLAFAALLLWFFRPRKVLVAS